MSVVEKYAIKMPLLNANEPRVTITKWHLDAGDRVDSGTVIATIETVKVTMDIVSDFSGYFFPVCPLNQEIIVGEAIAWILTENQPHMIKELTSSARDKSDVKVTEPALKLLSEHNLDLTHFKNKNVITKHDVLALLSLQINQQKKPVIDIACHPNAVLLYCAGNYAEVLYDAILEERKYQVAAFIDYSGNLTRNTIFNLPVYHPEQLQDIYNKGVRFIHINTNDFKKTEMIAEFSKKIGFKLLSIIHPKSAVAADAMLGENIYIGPQAVIGPGVKIGDFTKILNCASVAHHSAVGTYGQISDGARISGNVCVGNHCVIGLNAAINNHVTIGDHVIVVSMANVTQNIPDHAIWRHDGKIVAKKNAE